MFGFVQKERLVNVRLTPKTHEEFKIACELRGASMSSLLHQFIVRTIREERERDPISFNLVDLRTSVDAERSAGKVVGRILPGKKKEPTRDDVRIMYQKESDIIEVGEQKPQRKKKTA